MTKIKNTEAYPIKKYPVPADYIIGSDSEDNGKTVNFNLETIVNMVDGLIDYQYSLSSLPITTPNGDGIFQSQGITDFSAITKFQISKITLAGQDLTPFYTYLITNIAEYSIFLVSKTNRSIFAYYKIVSVAEIDDYFEFTVALSTANSYLGQLEDKEIYSFEYNKVDDNNPLTVITQTITDGDTTHAPSGDAVFDALAAIEAQIPDVFTKIVYFDSTNPATATIFDTNNPPVTNDDALKENVNYLYIGSDSSTWVYKTSPAGYVTYAVTSGGSNFYITGTSIDAGGVKTGSITKTGEIVIDSGTAFVSGFKLAQNPAASAFGSFSILTRNNTTGLIERTLDSNYVHTTGNESITGVKTIPNNSTTVGRFFFQNQASATTNAVTISNSSTSASGLRVTPSSGTLGIEVVGFGNSTVGVKIEPYNNNPEPTQKMLVLSNKRALNGSVDTTTPLTVLRDGTEVAKIDDFGNITANSFIKTGATANDILLGNGTTILNSAFLHTTGNENFTGQKSFNNSDSALSTLNGIHNRTAGTLMTLQTGSPLSNGTLLEINSTSGNAATNQAKLLVLNSGLDSVGMPFSVRLNGTDKATIDKNGNLTAAVGVFSGNVTGATPTLANHLVTKAYADGLVVGLLDDRGSYNASSNLFPTTGGSGTAGAVLKGDIWYVSVAGTLGGIAVAVGDSFRALADSPGQTASNWGILSSNIGYVPANDALVVHLAGTETITGLKTFTQAVTANSFIKTGGTAAQFLKADGSIDSNVYALDSNVVHKTGNEVISGLKSFNNSDATLSVIAMTTSNTTTAALTVANTGPFVGGINGTTSGTGGAIYGTTTGTGTAIIANNSQVGATGLLFEGKSGSTVFSVDKSGNTTSNAFIKSGGTASQYLMANGSISTLTNPVTGTGTNGQVSFWNGVNSQTGDSKFLYNSTSNILTLNASNGFFDVTKTANGSTGTPSFENVLRYGTPSGYGYIQGGNSYSSNFGTFWKFVVNGSGANSPIDAMTITSNGNVGIGTTSPNGRLEVASTGNNVIFTGIPSGSIAMGNNHPTNALPAIVGKSANSVGLQLNTITADNLVSGDMQFVTRELGNTDFTTLTNSAFRFNRFNIVLVDILRNGNVGIGTTPTAFKLEVKGSDGNGITYEGLSGVKTIMGVSPTIAQFGSLTSHRLDFLVGSAEKMSIVPSGNVLIATTTDNGVDKLQVNGTISTTGLSLDSLSNFDSTFNAMPINSQKCSTTGTVDIGFGGGFSFVESFKASTNDYGMQRITYIQGTPQGRIFIRTKNAGTWSAWVEK